MNTYSFDSTVEELNNYTLSLFEHYRTLHKHGLFHHKELKSHYIPDIYKVEQLISEIKGYTDTHNLHYALTNEIASHVNKNIITNKEAICNVLVVLDCCIKQIKLLDQLIFNINYKGKEITLTQMIDCLFSVCHLMRLSLADLYMNLSDTDAYKEYINNLTSVSPNGENK